MSFVWSESGFRFWLGSARPVQALLNFLFPPLCVNCRRVGSLLCAECEPLIPFIHEPVCPLCGRPGKLCGLCRQRPLPLQQIRAAVIFAGPARQVIHQIKYEGRFGLAPVAADWMAKAWPTWAVAFDLMIPVPLHPERLQKRGYNQSALIVHHLAQHFGWPVSEMALQRFRYTRPQVGLNALERLQNVQDAFEADPGRVNGKRILLVDDVCTTGATLVAAAQALLAAGAKNVTAYCVARAASIQDDSSGEQKTKK